MAAQMKPTEIYTSLDTLEKFKKCIGSAAKVHCEEFGRAINRRNMGQLKSRYQPRMHDSEVNKIIEWVLS